MATQEVVKCDACKKTIQPGEINLGIYCEEQRVEEPRGPVARARFRGMRRRQARNVDIDLCGAASCIAVLPSLIGRAFHAKGKAGVMRKSKARVGR